MDRSNVVPLRLPERAQPAAEDLARLALRAGSGGESLAELIHRLENDPQLRTLARRLARGLAWHGAEDLMQSTLERVVRGITSYRATGDLLGWVSRIMRNAQIEWSRKEAGEHAKLGEYAHQTQGHDEAVAERGIDEEERREQVLRVWRRRRHDPDVEVLWDRLYIGLTVEQIVRRTGHPRSTVYHMLKKGAIKFMRDWRALAARND